MKPKTNRKYVRRIIFESKIAFAVRHALIISLGAGLPLFAISSVLTLPSAALASEIGKSVKFNSDFIHGAGVDISRFYQGNPAPVGEYVIQVSINGKRRGMHKVVFNSVEGSTGAQPCFTEAELSRLGIKRPERSLLAADLNKMAECRTIDQWIEGANANYITGDFFLELTVPQASLLQHPRGYTDPNTWDSGVTAALIDYNSNIYLQQNSSLFDSNNGHTASGNLGLLAGLNFYDWRLRRRLNTNWSRGNSSHTQSLSTYLQRDVPELKSELTLGDSTTSGDLFDSMTVRGIQLASDDRMLPDGLRNYTPLVKGIAESNARVQVTQRGRILYETTVPPGPFEITDIGAMGYGGDLQVTVIEADGRQRTQIVPFSAPPMLLHDGVSRFGITVGRLQDDSLREKPSLAQAFYQYGLGNMYTLYGGGQFSPDYAAAGIGNAFNTSLGGISMDVTHARSDLGKGKSSSGNSVNIGFSKYLETTGTDVTLAAWRYSSNGFYSLRDAALERYGVRNDDYRIDYRTRQRLTVSLGQPLWNDARVSLSGSFYNYWNTRSSSSQYMLSYSKSERDFYWSVSASRAYNGSGKDVNSLMFSINVPLGRSSNLSEKPLFTSVYSTVSHDNNGGSSLQANAIGTQGEQNELSYGVGTMVNRTQNNSTSNAVNGNVNYNSSVGQFGSTASLGNQSNQLSISANGSLVAHSGGITAGPRLGDSPFALVEAPGAKGARILNGYGSEIDANGFAIVPSLTPYRENNVAVNTRGLPATVDVLENESTVIPRMGAIVKVNVKTVIGEPIVLKIKDKDGSPLPIGMDIYDDKNKSLSIIGQGGMAFVRGWQAEKSNLHVNRSNGKRLCTIYSDAAIARQMKNAYGTITQVEVICH
ncbi:fimbria/pilus outer membrane usher protein [Pantoea agglomerans]|uniref:fimbria/pilus outer membrane usher protein n=1 Tax=Enterobacter agglomerans TaxID=549 RepID=UPI003D2852A3